MRLNVGGATSILVGYPPPLHLTPSEPHLLLHIQQAQLVSATVLSEIMYILNLHSDVPIHLLVSVPSINTFMSSWTMLEPSEVDLSILSTGRARKRSAGVLAILQV